MGDLNDALRYVHLTQEQYDSIYNKPEENKSFLLENLPDYCNEFYSEFLSILIC